MHARGAAIRNNLAAPTSAPPTGNNKLAIGLLRLCCVSISTAPCWTYVVRVQIKKSKKVKPCRKALRAEKLRVFRL